MLSRLADMLRRFASGAPVSGFSPAPDALLGRPPVSLDTPELQRFIADKVILVTGAGGSIGSEICRQAMRFCPRRLILLDRAENALFEIDRELRERWVGSTLVPTVADVCDALRIGRIFETEKPDVVFHAAAHKHVPMMESNPGEAVKNNVLGTKIVADAASSHKCHAFVLISTDKAVNPTSVMGASKRCAELYVQSLNEGSGFRVQGSANSDLNPEPRTPNPVTRFLAVRFGNVLESSGSVVPIFRRQIAAGGPVTVTHPDMKRYFMTIPEASQLVMQAGAIGKGGEIFILDMGEPICILDLAHDMIRGAGLIPGQDIEVRFTGIRPGEKLHEELAGDDEQTRPTSHGKIRVWQLPRATRDQARRMITTLSAVCDGNRQDVIHALMESVPEYRTPEAQSSFSPLRLSPPATSEAA
jgi:FlaA1/EpsC-like NDP-sugar epimerase